MATFGASFAHGAAARLSQRVQRGFSRWSGPWAPPQVMTPPTSAQWSGGAPTLRGIGLARRTEGSRPKDLADMNPRGLRRGGRVQMLADLAAAADLQFTEHVVHVVLDGRIADPQGARDLLVGE